MLNLKYSLSSVGITAGAKKRTCSYEGYSLVSSPTSVGTVKPAAGFWWHHLPALLPVHNRAEVLGDPWRWLTLTLVISQMSHPVCPQGMTVSRGLEHHTSFEKEVQLYLAWCLRGT